MTASVEKVSEARCFGGVQGVYAHDSRETGTRMRFGLYLPPQALAGARVPVLVWLSGLTCTEENFIVKAGAQRAAAELGLALVAPDTSPRGLELPGERDAWDFGLGAGFYVDATQPPWSANYRMHSYVARELPELVAEAFPVDAARMGLFGHSMGGHGALTLALAEPARWRSVSAFAPIVAPTQVPWGRKAFAGYLGDDEAAWRAHDACELVRARGWRGPPILIDQGTADPFLDTQLQPERFEQACRDAGVALELRRRDGYDHGYFFIATFIDEHLRHHAQALQRDAGR